MVATDRKTGGAPPSRWLVAAIAAVALLAALAVFSVPLLISEDRLRERLQSEINETTGHTVSFGDDMDIAFLPVPRITIRDLEVTSYRAAEAEPLLVADVLTADFGLMSALLGNARYSNFNLAEPTLSLEVYDDGATSWMSERGHIAETTAIAADNARAELEAANEQTEPQPLPMTPLGIVTIKDGTIRIIDHGRERAETLVQVNGTLSWPRAGMGARLDLAAVLRDEPVRLVASAERPADLLAGNVAPFRLNFVSDILTLNYDGDASFRGAPVLSGSISLSSPSARRALRWSGAEVKPGEAIGALALEADLQASLPQITLNDLTLEIDDNRGIGALDVTWPRDQKPTISGTLAYETLDIGAFLRAFTPLPRDATDIAETIDTGFLTELGLDLRLSAQSAEIGPLTLADLAAAARIEEGRALFDIGDARVYGGNILGRVMISEQGFDGGGEIRFSARNVDFGAFYDALGMRGALPRGIGAMNIALTSPNPVWATTLQDLRGSLELSIRNGAIPMLDLARFRALSRTERFFEIGQTEGAELPFRSAALAATFANGTAEIGKGEIVMEDAAIVLAGLIPYDRGSLALSGAITAAPRPAPAEDAAGILRRTLDNNRDSAAGQPPLRFFIGGSWPTPVISPIVQD